MRRRIRGLGVMLHMAFCTAEPHHSFADAPAIKEVQVDFGLLEKARQGMADPVQAAFMENLMDSGVPAVVRHAKRALVDWAAFETWSSGFFESEIPALKAQVSSKPTSRMHSVVHPLHISNLAVANISWHRPFEEEVMPTRSFFEADVRPEAANRRYLSSFTPLQNLTARIQQGIGARTLLTSGFRPIVEVNVWMARENTASPLHYDGVHNAYVQVRGQKHFVLLPPSAWESVYLFPRLHPSSRMSQVEWTQVDHDEFPKACQAHASAMQLTLFPGDMLYIPPYWFHQVSAIGSPETSVCATHPSGTEH